VADARRSAPAAGSKRRLRLWLAFVAAFMGWAIYTAVQQMTDRAATGIELAAVQQKLSESEARKAELETEIDRLADPEYIMELARKNGMTLPGEQPIQATESGE